MNAFQVHNDGQSIDFLFHLCCTRLLRSKNVLEKWWNTYGIERQHNKDNCKSKFVEERRREVRIRLQWQWQWQWQLQSKFGIWYFCCMCSLHQELPVIAIVYDSVLLERTKNELQLHTYRHNSWIRCRRRCCRCLFQWPWTWIVKNNHWQLKWWIHIALYLYISKLSMMKPIKYTNSFCLFFFLFWRNAMHHHQCNKYRIETLKLNEITMHWMKKSSQQRIFSTIWKWKLIVCVINIVI